MNSILKQPVINKNSKIINDFGLNTSQMNYMNRQ